MQTLSDNVDVVDVVDTPTVDLRWIQLKPSRLQLAVTLAGAVAAVTILAMIDLPIWFKVAAIAITALATLWELQRQLLKNRTAIDAFYFIELDQKIEEVAKKGEDKKGEDKTPKLGIRLRKVGSSDFIQAEVLESAFVMPLFANVPYRLPGDGLFRKFWPRTLPLWRDSLDSEAFRQVRVRLRWT